MLPSVGWPYTSAAAWERKDVAQQIKNSLKANSVLYLGQMADKLPHDGCGSRMKACFRKKQT